MLFLTNHVQAIELKEKSFLNVCNVKNDIGSSDQKNCNEMLMKFPIDSEAATFCEENSSDLFMRRVCFMAIANKKFPKSELEKCKGSTNGAPPTACIDLSNNFVKLTNFVEGKKYLSVCDISGESKISSDKKHCSKILSEQMLDENAVIFCEKKSYDPVTKRSCFMSIANKKFSKTELEKCKDGLSSGAPVAACLDLGIASSEVINPESKNCRSDCECVIGSYMKCPEGTYYYSGDSLSSKIDNSSRKKFIKKIGEASEQNLSNPGSIGVSK